MRITVRRELEVLGPSREGLRDLQYFTTKWEVLLLLVPLVGSSPGSWTG